MLKRIRRKRFVDATRRFVVIVSLFAFLVAAAGVPLPRIQIKSSATPFPCQFRPCGCSNADSCWRACCCFTDEEKLAWSREHGVEVPQFLLARIERDKYRSHETCCTESHTDSTTDDPSDNSTQVGVTIASVARECQGQPPLWSMLGATLPAPTISWDFAMEQVGWLESESMTLMSLSSEPAIPPPRA